MRGELTSYGNPRLLRDHCNAKIHFTRTEANDAFSQEGRLCNECELKYFSNSFNGNKLAHVGNVLNQMQRHKQYSEQNIKQIQSFPSSKDYNFSAQNHNVLIRKQEKDEMFYIPLSFRPKKSSDISVESKLQQNCSCELVDSCGFSSDTDTNVILLEPTALCRPLVDKTEGKPSPSPQDDLGNRCQCTYKYHNMLGKECDMNTNAVVTLEPTSSLIVCNDEPEVQTKEGYDVPSNDIKSVNISCNQSVFLGAHDIDNFNLINEDEIDKNIAFDVEDIECIDEYNDMEGYLSDDCTLSAIDCVNGRNYMPYIDDDHHQLLCGEISTSEASEDGTCSGGNDEETSTDCVYRDRLDAQEKEGLATAEDDCSSGTEPLLSSAATLNNHMKVTTKSPVRFLRSVMQCLGAELG